jgi:protein O-mannosyl-transferase
MQLKAEKLFMFMGILQKPKGWVVLVLAMIALLAVVWQPVLSNGFLTNWGDQWMVTGNPHLFEVTHLNTISTDAIATTFSEPYGGQYSPINTLAYMVIVRAGGMEPFGFQLFFLIVHILNFLLVGLVLQKMLLMITGLELKDSHRIAISWAVAFLFAIHPMQVEAVAWISASKVVLYSFFYLLGLWFYLIYRQTRKTRWFWAVMFCFLASMLTKEQAVVFVLTLVLVDWAVLPKTDEECVLPKTMWLEKVPFFIAAVLFGVATILIPEHSGTGGEAYPFGQRLLFASYSFWEYLVKLTAPYGLSHFYFFPMDPGQAIPLQFWFYPLATAFFIWMLYEFRNNMNRVLVFGGLFFLVNIITALHIIPVPREVIIADRYVYMSSIGFFLVAVYVIHQWIHRKKNTTRKVVLAACCVYLLLLAGYSHERVRVWENMDTLNENIGPLIEMHNKGLTLNLPGPFQ